MIRVLLADDHILLRQGVRRLLECERDVEVIAEANNGIEVQTMVGELRPDVVLMDISMPIVDGISATREILRQWPETKIVILSMYAEEAHVFQALRAGASGYVLKSAGFDNVIAAVRAAVLGGGMIAPDLTAKVLAEFRRMSSKVGSEDGVGDLSDVEAKMLQLIASGMSNKEIALHLSFAESTVKNRVSVLFQKIGVSDRTQAAIYAIAHGVIPLRNSEHGASDQRLPHGAGARSS